MESSVGNRRESWFVSEMLEPLTGEWEWRGRLVFLGLAAE